MRRLFSRSRQREILVEAVEARRLYSATGPDLAVTNWGCAIGDFEVGTTSSAIITVANNGDTPVTSKVKLYLSTDQTLSTDDVFVTSVDVSLDAGAAKSPMLSPTWPANLAGGQYYPILVADQDNTVAEVDETNNTFIGSPITLRTPVSSTGYVPQYESLYSQSLGANWWVPAPYVPGQRLRVDLNLRGFDQAYHVPVTFYVSADDVAGNGDDVAIGSATAVRIMPGYGNAFATVSLPTDLAPGTYHLVAIAEGGTPFLGNSFEVVANQTDLAVTSVTPTGTATAGSVLSVDTTFSVTSPAPTPYNGLFDVSYILSADNVVGNGDDIVLLTRPVMVSPSSSTQSVQVTSYLQIPANVPAGSYRLIVKTDIGNNTAETDEANNVMVTEPFEVSAPSGGEEEPAVPFETQAQSTPPGVYKLRFYASPDERLSKDDKLLFQRTVVVRAGENGSELLVQALTLPANVKLGTNRLIVVTSEVGAGAGDKQVKLMPAKAVRSAKSIAAGKLSAAIRSVKRGPTAGTARVTIRVTNTGDALFSSNAVLKVLTDSVSPETVLSVKKALTLKAGKHVDITLTVRRPASTGFRVSVS